MLSLYSILALIVQFLLYRLKFVAEGRKLVKLLLKRVTNTREASNLMLHLFDPELALNKSLLGVKQLFWGLWLLVKATQLCYLPLKRITTATELNDLILELFNLQSVTRWHLCQLFLVGLSEDIDLRRLLLELPARLVRDFLERVNLQKLCLEASDSHNINLFLFLKHLVASLKLLYIVFNF